MARRRWLRFWFDNAYTLYRTHLGRSRAYSAWRGAKAALAGARQGLWR